MRLTVTLTYDAAPEEVAAMLADPAFQRELCAETGDPSAEVSVMEHRGAHGIRTARRLPTDRMPDAMRALVGAEVTAVQTTNWADSEDDGSRTGTVNVVVVGTPVRLAAAAHLGPAHGGTQVTYDGELTATVPFIGRKVERAAEPVVRSALEAERRVGLRWLTTGRS